MIDSDATCWSALAVRATSRPVLLLVTTTYWVTPRVAAAATLWLERNGGRGERGHRGRGRRRAGLGVGPGGRE